MQSGTNIPATMSHDSVSMMPPAGRGRQVIAVCKSADLLLMVLDASKPHAHRKILTAELEAVGIRLNRRPPSIYFKKKKTAASHSMPPFPSRAWMRSCASASCR